MSHTKYIEWSDHKQVIDFQTEILHEISVCSSALNNIHTDLYMILKGFLSGHRSTQYLCEHHEQLIYRTTTYIEPRGIQITTLKDEIFGYDGMIWIANRSYLGKNFWLQFLAPRRDIPYIPLGTSLKYQNYMQECSISEFLELIPEIAKYTLDSVERARPVSGKRTQQIHESFCQTYRAYAHLKKLIQMVPDREIPPIIHKLRKGIEPCTQ